MSKTLFFTLGPALILAALALSALGLRKKEFPSKGAMRGILVVFTGLVVAVMVFAVLNANSESLGRENQQAAARLRTEAEQKAAQQANNLASSASGPAQAGQLASPAQKPATSGSKTTLSVTSPANGGLSYTPSSLSAQAGTVTINYKNPSPIPHSIAIEGAGATSLASTQPNANTTLTVTATLKPGKYFFYCTVPGHRQAGMQGTLTVK